MITNIEQKKSKLKEVKEKIKKLQKERMALDSYIRLYEWRKKKESEK